MCEKYCRAGRALSAGYLRLQIHTLRLCKTQCFSTATIVARTRLNITLYVHCLSFFFFRAAVKNRSLATSLFEDSESHTIRHRHTPRKTPLNELSARSRGRYLRNTQHTQETNILTLSWFRTSDPSNTAAADLRVKPRGRWDRRTGCLGDEIKAGEMDWALSTQHKFVRNFCRYAWREYVT
jgi:hypothetical protein